MVSWFHPNRHRIGIEIDRRTHAVARNGECKGGAVIPIPILMAIAMAPQRNPETHDPRPSLSLTDYLCYNTDHQSSVKEVPYA
jgi:hypothetical protein